MNFKHIKPYLFILAFLIVPLLFVPAIKIVKNNFLSENEYKDSFNTIDSLNLEAKKYGLVIHGGAGNFNFSDINDTLSLRYQNKLYEALQFGIDKLKKGDSAVYVVIEVIKMLEDSPLFNAGKGSVFTHEGTNELDASIMTGHNQNAGAVAGVTTIKNPIEAAFQVMTNSKHVLLSGKGAEEFAKNQQVKIVPASYFYTEKRWKNLQKSLSKEKMGTVGCVVLDKYGNLAAGTSTGGMTNKKYGRIGDSPIIGAGTFADNATCAISATGHGEYFIRYSVAHDINARMKYLNENINTSAERVIKNLKQNGGNGGVIGIDRKGNITMSFNTTGMFRGFCMQNSEPQVFLFEN